MSLIPRCQIQALRVAGSGRETPQSAIFMSSSGGASAAVKCTKIDEQRFSRNVAQTLVNVSVSPHIFAYVSKGLGEVGRPTLFRKR